MLSDINHFLVKNVSIIVFSGIFIGLSSSIFGKLNNRVLASILFLELFVACFKISRKDIVKINPKSISLFLIFRYLVFPILIFYLGSFFDVNLGIALLLLSLLPTGVTSPGFAAIFNANVAVVLSAVLITGILSPFYIPFIIDFIASSNIEIKSYEILKTITLIVIFPMVLHIPFRKIKSINSVMLKYNPLFIIPMVWLTTVVPVSKYRDFIFSDFLRSIRIIILFLILYFIFFIIGKIFSKLQKTDCVKSYLITSSIHNITLGVVIALMYFPKEVSSLIILANISAIIMVSLLKRVLDYYS